ncbi:MAG TPA: GntR family transcriptional regulator [Xanthobacteraceae bacterium]
MATGSELQKRHATRAQRTRIQPPPSKLPRAGDRSAPAPRDPTPVRAQLAQTLRALVTDGVYKAGDRMTERELCERLGVSRPSLREALRQLEAEGLVDILPNRGPVVRMVTLSDVLELWEVRTALETLIARRIATHGTHRQVEVLEKAIHDFDAALQSEDVGFIKSTKAAFFEAFAAGANSAILTGYFRQVNARLSFLWSSSLMFPGRPAESISELFALLAAIKNRNPAAAEAAVLLHIEHGKAIAMYGLRVFEESRRIAPAGRSRRPAPEAKQ